MRPIALYGIKYIDPVSLANPQVSVGSDGGGKKPSTGSPGQLRKTPLHAPDSDSATQIEKIRAGSEAIVAEACTTMHRLCSRLITKRKNTAIDDQIEVVSYFLFSYHIPVCMS